MHEDAESSDTTAQSGPGASDVDIKFRCLMAACPTILGGSPMDNGTGGLWALVTNFRLIPDRRIPVVHLLDQSTLKSIAACELKQGSTLGGTYAYLDNQNRVVIIDGSRHLKFVAWRNNGETKELFVDDEFDLTALIKAGDDSVAVVPSWDGDTWFATRDGFAGYKKPSAEIGCEAVLQLSEYNRGGEDVANAIASSPDGIAVATTYGLYLLDKGNDGDVIVKWCAKYDRGRARKPGQLSWGTGSSPTFFGPTTGYEYLAIVDNHFGEEGTGEVDRSNLNVYDVTDGTLVAQAPMFADMDRSNGTEMGVIAYRNNIYVTNSYGYDYPSQVVNPKTSCPRSAPFDGGVQRFDLNESLELVSKWVCDVRATSTPKLSRSENLIYTFSRSKPFKPGEDGNTIWLSVINAKDGLVVRRTRAGRKLLCVKNTMGMSVSIHDGVLYQGTMNGIFKVTPR